MKLIYQLVLIFLLSHHSMASDPFEVSLRATVRITDGNKSGTGFFVTSDPKDKNSNSFLVTAAHVFRDFSGEMCTVILRQPGADNKIIRKEVTLKIRDGKKPLWKQHAKMDAAAIIMPLPQGTDIQPFASSQIGIPAKNQQVEIRAGQDICIPCFPANLEANPAGWPILRKGSLASNPNTPEAESKTFFVDVSTFGGDSGAPVVAWTKDAILIIGLITRMQRQTDKVVMPLEERTVHTPLGIGVAVQATVIKEVIDQLQN